MASDQIWGLRRTTPNPNAPTVPGAQPFRPENPNPVKAPFDPLAAGDEQEVPSSLTKLNEISRMHAREQGDADLQKRQIAEMQSAPAPTPTPPPEEDLPSMESVVAMFRKAPKRNKK